MQPVSRFYIGGIQMCVLQKQTTNQSIASGKHLSLTLGGQDKNSECEIQHVKPNLFLLC